MPDDAAAIATVRTASWRAAYRDLMPAGFLASLRPEAMADRLRARLTDPEYPFRTLVGELDGRVAGFATIGPCRDDDMPGAGEVLAIYVHPDHWSRGLGRALMSDALVELDALGQRPVTLWVLRDNARARAFYQRAGFIPDGSEHVYEAGGVPVPEVRYRRG